MKSPLVCIQNLPLIDWWIHWVTVWLIHSFHHPLAQSGSWLFVFQSVILLQLLPHAPSVAFIHIQIFPPPVARSLLYSSSLSFVIPPPSSLIKSTPRHHPPLSLHLALLPSISISLLCSPAHPCLPSRLSPGTAVTKASDASFCM